MLPAFIISLSVLFLLFVGMFVLILFFPYIDSFFEKIFKGELAVSVFEMFVLVFVFAVILFGGIGLLVGIL